MPIKNIVTGQKVTKEKLERAKELRREMTPAEKLLWQEVRAKKLGVRFRPPPPSAPPQNPTLEFTNKNSKTLSLGVFPTGLCKHCYGEVRPGPSNGHSRNLSPAS